MPARAGLCALALTAEGPRPPGAGETRGSGRWRTASEGTRIATVGAVDGPAEAGDSRRPVRVRSQPLFLIWVVTFALLSALEWFWVVATPLGSGFDEASHVIKAAAVVRGEWLGQPLPHMSHAYTWMIVPETFSQLTYRSDCYKLSPMTPASCEKAIVESSAPVRALTHVGRYPPLYYLFVGIPSLFGHSKNALYMMRFFSAMVSAALLALAVTLAFGYGGGRLLLAGIAVSLSPALFYLGSIVEPSSLEVSSAVCLWTALLLLVRRRPGPIPRPLVAAATLSAAALDLTRGLSPMWLVAILFVTLVVLTPPTRLREMWHDSAVRAGAVVVAVATGLAIAWTVGTDSLAFVRNLPNPFVHDSYPVIMRAIFARTWSYVVEMLGGFNPRNTHASLGLLIVVGCCLVALVLVALVRGSGRERLAMGLLVVATVLAPVLLASLHARTDGVIWQGRYVLPLTAGLPLIAGLAGAAPRGARSISRSSRLIAPVTVIAMLSVQLVALYGLLRRFAVGDGGPLDLTLKAPGAWAPPIPSVAVIAGAAVATVVAVVWWLWLVERVEPGADNSGAAASAGGRVSREAFEPPAVVRA